MFWGLIMEPQRRYTQKVKKAFHISMAALDISTSSEEPAQVMCGFEGRNYLLCTLKKPDMLQCPLDLNFDVGSELSFAANGKCHVHLTGYLIEEPIEESLDELEEEESEQESEEEEVEVNQKKRSKQKNGPPSKKSKLSVSDQATVEEDSGSENSDVDIGALLENTLESDDDDASFKTNQEEAEEEASEEDTDDDVEEEEDDDDDDEDEEAEDEQSSLSEAESEDEEVEKSPKKKSKQVNGVAKPEPSPKAKKEQQQKAPEQKQKGNKNDATPKAAKKELNGGVIIEDIKEGQGPSAKAGKFVNVYYEGRLKQNNKVFDAAKKGAGFSFRLGSGEVIKAWDVGVVGMKPGGKRRIICPPAMAYGQKGSPPAIPGNSTLVFEVELKKIR